MMCVYTMTATNVIIGYERNGKSMKIEMIRVRPN